MAEVHIIGQIIGGSGFPENNLFCKWSIHAGGAWDVLSGQTEGQTQVDSPQDGEMAHFCHPVDVYYVTKGLQGWPKLSLEVYHHDWCGRNELYGYGFCNIPTTPGFFELECVTWRPAGSFMEQISQNFVGGGPQLRRTDIVHSGGDRCYLQTASMGKIHLQLNVILRNFDKFGVDF